MISRPIDEASAVASAAELDVLDREILKNDLLADTSSALWMWILPSFTSAADGVAENGGD